MISNSKKNKEIIENKYFIPIFVISVNLIFFLICNLVFELRYETIDDFNIINIISKLDGTYNFYAVYIHPVLSYIIMLLYKTGVNINWYTIFMLCLQFLSFTTIGIILLKKNRKIGIISYIFIILTIYMRILVLINYTSVAAITILAGVISIIYYIETSNKKTNILGLILIAVGTMLRWKSIIIVLPFYIVYMIYDIIKNKKYISIKMFIYILIIFLTIYISNSIIYKISPIYKHFTEFNDVRTYFFDSNILDYKENEEAVKKSGWTENDLELLYTYSFADENFYTIENLTNLKNNINVDINSKIDKVINSIVLFLYIAKYQYIYLFIFICLITISACIFNKKSSIIIGYLLAFFILSLMLCYTKPMYRVLVPTYGTTITMMTYMYIGAEKKNDNKPNKYDKIIQIVISFSSIIIIVLDCYSVYERRIVSDKRYTLLIKELISYINNDKNNAYVYANTFGNISTAYSIYEKIPDNTFLNLRHMGDWDIYNKEYYIFKDRYNIDNIISDLYKKDNLYIITGSAGRANNTICYDHIGVITEYIKEHFEKVINYKVIKEFDYDIKIYKLYE